MIKNNGCPIRVSTKNWTSSLFSKLKKANQKTGFTLIELLIVLAMFSVLSGCVFSVFAQSVKLLKRISDKQIMLDQVILAEKLRSDLGNAIISSDSGFSGSEIQLSFLLYNGDRIWRPDGVGGIISKVIYRSNRSKNTIEREENYLEHMLYPEYNIKSEKREFQLSESKDFVLKYLVIDKIDNKPVWTKRLSTAEEPLCFRLELVNNFGRYQDFINIKNPVLN